MLNEAIAFLMYALGVVVWMVAGSFAIGFIGFSAMIVILFRDEYRRKRFSGSPK